MPDLDRSPVLDWVTACAPELLTWSGTPVRAVEEDGEILGALIDLGQTLDFSGASEGGLREATSGGSAAKDLHAVLLQLGPARLLRLLRWLGMEGGEERAAVLRDLLGGVHGDAAHLAAAVDALHRRELLDRIFDEARLQQLLAATRTATQGDAA